MLPPKVYINMITCIKGASLCQNVNISGMQYVKKTYNECIAFQLADSRGLH